MNAWRSWLISGHVLLLATSLLSSQELSPRTTTLRAPEGFKIQEAVLVNLDLDREPELLLYLVSAKEQRTRRLEIYRGLKGPETLAASAEQVIPLTPDATAFATGDVNARPGIEILLFNGSGAFVLLPRGAGRLRARRLLEAAFLYQFPRQRQLLYLPDLVRDVNGDGLDDLVLPEPDGYRIALQKRSPQGTVGFEQTTRLSIPRDPQDARSETLGALHLRGKQTRQSLLLRLEMGRAASEQARPLLQVLEAVPAPQWADWDGDGDLDLLARTESRLLIWIQEPGGLFSKTPRYRLLMPVVADRARRLDISYSAHILDLNQDRRADCLFVVGNQNSEKVRSQVLVYLQGAGGRGPAATTPQAPLFGPQGIPQELLPLAGFAGLPRLDDVNQDGAPDLSVASFRPDLIDTLRSGSNHQIEIGWHVFFNHGGRFSRKPDLNDRLQLKTASLQSNQGLLTPRFMADLNGDGMGELVLQDSPQSLVILTPERNRRSWHLRKKPLFVFHWQGEGRVRLFQRRGEHPRILVIRQREVQVVSLLP